MSKTSSTKQRDPLLDIWRGLALIDMSWVHLATYPVGMAALLAVWIGDYTRFAAGAFVFISGLSVARVFGPKLTGSPASVRTTRRRLLRRALTLACLDRIVAVAFTLIERSLSVPPTVTPGYPDIADLLLFAEPGATGGLLLLYAILLTATPLLDAALRRFGSGAILFGSLGIYGLAHAGAFGSHGAVWPFPVAYWQPLFVAGYVVSHRIAGLRDSRGHVSGWWLAAISGAFAVVFLLRNGVSIGLVPPSALPALEFVKVPLSPAELLWYLAVSGFVLTWSAWAWERAAWVRWPLGWVSLLGRQSLLVYVAHFFVQLSLVEALTLIDPSPLARAMMLPLMVVLLIGIAAAGEALDRVPTRRAMGFSAVSVPPRLPTSAIMGSAVAAGALSSVIALQVLIGPPASWTLATSADARYGLEAMAEIPEAIVSTEEGDPYSEQVPLPAEAGGDGYPGSLMPAEDADHPEMTSET